MMALSSCACLYLIPAAATNQPPRFPVSSILFLGGGSGSGGIARGDLLVRRSPSPNFYGKRSPNSHSITITPRFRCSSQPVLDLAPATSAAYGLLLIGGGLFAYTRSGSKGSLLGGFSGGSLMLASYILMQATEMKEIGDALAFGSALLFASVFGIRLAATRKIIPAGPLLGLSICALAVFISAYLQDSL
ncbi:protein FATTY ACID EXPORT 4, chloroplastic isoform X1 [Actinidia eriantha]|uniref:protein FATTY ACID EXPORT 4, chloroplastic isoform X1 n=1 Tax=Actinidia eriantha TaxID=165200 RepID=UPI00258421C4|nr:protein FATTY ACID EXPORT 4, chloroplastic isoform X1 [Actinidia eriantha]